MRSLSAVASAKAGTPGLMSVACLLVVAVAAQERPLPEREAFLRETRRHLQTDTSLQSSYVYVETRREQKLDKRGRVLEESVKVVESYPGLPGENRWERLIAENGRPRPAAELENLDRDRQRQAEAFARRLAEQPAKERARQERDLAEQRREFDAIVDDILIVFDIDMRGRGHRGPRHDRALAHAASEGETADARGKADAEVLPPRLDQRVRS